MAGLALFSLLALGGCRSFDPKHPLLGHPEIRPQKVSAWVWYAKDRWHVRLVGAGHPHRFQGSLEGVNGGVTELHPTRPELAEHIGADSSAVHFDVETSTRDDSVGFDAKIAGGCARFELLTDGAPRAESVRLGRRGQTPRKLPVERCP